MHHINYHIISTVICIVAVISCEQQHVSKKSYSSIANLNCNFFIAKKPTFTRITFSQTAYNTINSFNLYDFSKYFQTYGTLVLLLYIDRAGTDNGCLGKLTSLWSDKFTFARETSSIPPYSDIS